MNWQLKAEEIFLVALFAFAFDMPIAAIECGDGHIHFLPIPI